MIGKFLEDDQPRSERTRMLHDRTGQGPGSGGAHRIVAIEVGFARDASNHHGLHEHESRPSAPDRISQTSEIGMNSREDILVKNEERLDRLNLALMVPDGEIPVIEFRVDGVLDNFVIATILVLRGERALPMYAIAQLMARNDSHAAATPGRLATLTA